MQEHKVAFTPDALESLIDIVSYIRDTLRNPPAAMSVYNKLKSAATSLCLMPEHIPFSRYDELAKKSVRCMSVENYLILFRVIEAENLVEILNFVYGKRNQREILSALTKRGD